MTPEHHLTFGPFRLEMTQGRLWRGDQVLPLRPRSLALLGYLVTHAGRLVTKAEVQAQVGGGTHITTSVLQVSVREIRAVLGDSKRGVRIGGRGEIPSSRDTQHSTVFGGTVTRCTTP